MARSIQKFRHRVSEHGLLGAFRIVWHKSFTGRRKKKIFALGSPEDRFTRIYETNHWNNFESRSGEGSTIGNTAILRAALPAVFEKYEVERFLDAPCGDFNWMQAVVDDTDIIYIGGDIVRPLVEQNVKNFASDRISFQHLDLTRDPLPAVDMMMCRDCLFHLSYRDIAKVLQNVLASDVPLLLTTTIAAPGGARLKNKDIETGDMRRIDLFSHPFNAPKDVLEVVNDPLVSRSSERFMVLLDRDAVATIHQSLLESLGPE